MTSCLMPFLAALCSSPTGLFAAGAILPSTTSGQRGFSSSSLQPNPLGNTNTSGVGDDPVGSSSAPDDISTKPNPLAASTAVSIGSSTKPSPLQASPSVASDSAPKPDPLAASTNVKPDSGGAATSSYSKQQVSINVTLCCQSRALHQFLFAADTHSTS